MALVPPGCFMMGSNSSENNGNEKPITRICFDKSFWIDKTEVTQAQFRSLGGKAASKPAFTGDNRPVESITWFEARDFCAQRGGRLPTEAEWEYAARGPDGRDYPWANVFVEDMVVFAGNSKQQTADVGSKPRGASWVGALDMSGNVWEWTNSLERLYPYNAKDGRESNSDTKNRRILRGGSWFDLSHSFLRASVRVWDYPWHESHNYGFRCARPS
jgi:formylglycine-generating enzyme required for sulfatase activity